MRHIIVLILLFLAGCDRIDFTPNATKQLQEKVQTLENRVLTLEARASQSGDKSDANWIMWKRQVTVGFGYAGPVNFNALSAYESKGKCLEAAKSVIPAGANQTSFEPPRFEWLDQRADFACLPMGARP